MRDVAVDETLCVCVCVWYILPRLIAKSTCLLCP